MDVSRRGWGWGGGSERDAAVAAPVSRGTLCFDLQSHLLFTPPPPNVPPTLPPPSPPPRWCTRRSTRRWRPPPAASRAPSSGSCSWRASARPSRRAAAAACLVRRLRGLRWSGRQQLGHLQPHVWGGGLPGLPGSTSQAPQRNDTTLFFSCSPTCPCPPGIFPTDDAFQPIQANAQTVAQLNAQPVAGCVAAAAQAAPVAAAPDCAQTWVDGAPGTGEAAAGCCLTVGPAQGQPDRRPGTLLLSPCRAGCPPAPLSPLPAVPLPPPCRQAWRAPPATCPSTSACAAPPPATPTPPVSTLMPATSASAGGELAAPGEALGGAGALWGSSSGGCTNGSCWRLRGAEAGVRQPARPGSPPRPACRPPATPPCYPPPHPTPSPPCPQGLRGRRQGVRRQRRRAGAAAGAALERASGAGLRRRLRRGLARHRARWGRGWLGRGPVGPGAGMVAGRAVLPWVLLPSLLAVLPRPDRLGCLAFHPRLLPGPASPLGDFPISPHHASPPSTPHPLPTPLQATCTTRWTPLPSSAPRAPSTAPAPMCRCW